MQKQPFFKSVIAWIALPALCAGVALNTDGSAWAASLSDSQILGIYIQANGFEIETALLCRAQGASASILQVAKHVAADHLGVRQVAYTLAEECRVSIQLPAERSSVAMEHGKAMNMLLSLSGPAFDRAYAEHEVAFHRSAIEAVRATLLPAATCPALKDHLNKVLPAFEHHLAKTEAIKRELTAH